MRWEEQLVDLFDDLEQQAQLLAEAERGPEVADRSRAEYRQVSLASRLMASLGQSLRVEVSGLGALSLRLDRVAREWCLLSGAGQEWIVALAALEAVTGASPRSVPEVAWPRVSTLGLGSALRRLAETGEGCVLHRRSGGRHEGRLERVGADFVELREREDRVTLVSFDALAAAQSRDQL